MAVQTKLIVGNTAASQLEPLASGDVVSGELLQLSSDAGNVLTNGADGGLYAPPVPTTPIATDTTNGLMSSTDKGKLDGIEAGAQVNPGAATDTTDGLFSKTDKAKLDGVEAGAEKNPGVATSTSDGLLSKEDKSTIDALPSSFYTPTVVTTTTDGLMSSVDKVKLDGVEAGAQVNPGVATTTTTGLMSANDKAKLDGLTQTDITTTASLFGDGTTADPLGVQLSADTGNALVAGSDGGLFVAASSGSDVVTDRTLHGDGTSSDPLGVVLSSDPSNVLQIGADGGVLATDPEVATTTTDGLLSAADKTKLNGIDAGAQVNPGVVTSTAAGLAPTGVAGFLRFGASGAQWTTEMSATQLANGTDTIGRTVPPKTLRTALDEKLGIYKAAGAQRVGMQTGNAHVFVDTTPSTARVTFESTTYFTTVPNVFINAGQKSSSCYVSAIDTSGFDVMVESGGSEIDVYVAWIAIGASI